MHAEKSARPFFARGNVDRRVPPAAARSQTKLTYWPTACTTASTSTRHTEAAMFDLITGKVAHAPRPRTGTILVSMAAHAAFVTR